MIKVSAVIITFNEERNIARCLQSLVDVADEIIVLDSYSTDQTPLICEKFNVKFIQHPFEGYSAQKNFANTFVQYEYILSLDADEALSVELAKLIKEFKLNPKADVVVMKRKTNYCGQWILYSGWYPDKKIRLWKKGCATWNMNTVHESPERLPNTSLLYLDADILHYSYYTIEEHRLRSKRYAEISSKALYAEGKTISLLMVYIKCLSKFIRNYIILLGFLDGRNGFRICSISASDTYLKYRLLYELNKKKPETV